MTSRLRRFLGFPLVVLVLLVGLLWPVAVAWLEQQAGDEVSDPVSISSYDATFTVGADGMLVATEQIRAEFPSGRRGIFRYWDVADPADNSVRYLPTVVSVTRDGQPEPYALSWTVGHRFLVARIGDADTYLTPGPHTYVLSYQIPGALSPGDTSATAPFTTTAGEDPGPPGSAFLWSVVASGWEMPIAQANVTVELPSESGQVQCTTDPWGTPGPCSLAGAGTRTVQASASDLAPRTGMILRATLQPPAPDRGHLPWSVTWDPVLGRTVWVTAALALLAVGAGLVGHLMARSTREDEPGFPVQYEPPPGLGPVQVVYLAVEQPGPAPLVASVLHLAERGLVRLERPTEETWRITNIGTPEQWAATDPVSWSVARDLGLLGGVSFAADGSAGAGKVLKAADEAIGGELAGWSQRAGLMAGSSREQGLKVLWFAMAGAAVLLFALPGILTAAGQLALVPTLAGLVPGAFVLGGLGLTSHTVGQRRTRQGRREWARAGGFRRLLSTPSAEERFDFSARTEAFIAFIPYAVAFGVADTWAEKYRAEMGMEPPIPVWYPWYAGRPVGDFYSGGQLNSFATAVTASIGAYAAAQAASRGSSGGGGGSFGGGGGGGGGSW